MRTEPGLRHSWVKVFAYLPLLIAALTAMDMLSTETDQRFLIYGHFLFNAVPSVLLFALLFAFCRNPKISIIITIFFCGLIYLANYSIHDRWHTFLVPAHFELLFVDIEIPAIILSNLRLPMALAVMLTAFTASSFVLKLRLSRMSNFNVSPVARMTIIMAVGAVTFGLYAGKGATSAAMRFVKMEPAEFDMREQLKYGLFNHLYLSSAQPVLYDSMIAGNSTRILDYAKSRPISGSHNLQAPPNVVVVLAESLMDPKTLATEFRNDPLAGLRADGAENRAEGLARVHVVGGRSWISEFTLLTGIPSLLLGSNSLWPFDLASSDTWTLARAFKGQGYKTYALYAPRGDFLYNARETYLRLGFDKFLDVEDFNIWFGDMDASADEKLLKAADQILRDESGPVFIFAVSFDLHMPYDSIGNGRFVDRSVGTPGMQEFFRRESIFAAQLTQFLEKQDQEASQLLFGIVGDHIPPMPRAFEEIGFREDVEAPLYRTHYLLHSNHAPLNAAATGMDMDLSFFASLILDSAGLDGGQYFRVNSAVRELCRGRFVLCDAPSDLLQSYYAYLGANLTMTAPQ